MELYSWSEHSDPAAPSRSQSATGNRSPVFILGGSLAANALLLPPYLSSRFPRRSTQPVDYRPGLPSSIFSRLWIPHRLHSWRYTIKTFAGHASSAPFHFRCQARCFGHQGNPVVTRTGITRTRLRGGEREIRKVTMRDASWIF